MNRIREAVEYCQQRGGDRSVFVIPFQVNAADVRWLCDQPSFAAMILHNPDPEITATSSYKWLGCYASDGISWQMPENTGRFIFLGPPIMITRAMVEQIRSTGRRAVTCVDDRGVTEIPLYRFRLWDLGDRIVRRVITLPEDHLIAKAVRAARSLPWLRAVWRAMLRREFVKSENSANFSPDRGPESATHLLASIRGRIARNRGNGRVASYSESDVGLYREMLTRAGQSSFQKVTFVPRKILLVNAGLAAGGAERQVVNSLLGLKAHGYEDSELLGEYLFASPGLDFYLPLLKQAEISASQVECRVTLSERGLASVDPAVAEMLTFLPAHLIVEILNLVEEFRVRRPELVHAWQDSTSVKCGIAAAIAGIPKIILSSRNVNPSNFAYYQKYMKPAYLALAELENVTLLNNSEAGANDYCSWLGLPRSRYRVIRNGMNFANLQRVTQERVAAYRQTLGIPDDAPIIGSIFRFWPEKRPMLWLEVAKHVAKSLPTTHFLLIGDGPMRGEMETFLSRTELKRKVHLPGARSDIATPLSTMDLFLLTSEFEGTPNVVLESQWLGVPVVATDSGGTRDAILEGATGWIVEDVDAVAISKRVISGVQDREWRVRVSSEGPQFIRETFSLDKMVMETLSAYGLPSDRYPEMDSSTAHSGTAFEASLSDSSLESLGAKVGL